MSAKNKKRNRPRTRITSRPEWIGAIIGLVAFFALIYWFGIRENKPAATVDAARP